MKQFFYLGWWFFKVRFLKKEIPLQTVLFITDKCNLTCRHCSVYNEINPVMMSFQQVKKELEYSYNLGSRFVDFEGGEPTLWFDGDKTVNDLILLAKQIGFFSCTITTNAQESFKGSLADSIWVSLDGKGKYHDTIRGNGAFEKLDKNITEANHKELSVNMVVNSLNYEGVEETLDYVKENKFIKSISFNFHTPFEGTEDLMLDKEKRNKIIDIIISYKKEGYPIMNSISGLKLMKENNFKKRCWITNFILADGTHLKECAGKTANICDDCGFCMSAEEHCIFSFKLDTIFAGLKLRVNG